MGAGGQNPGQHPVKNRPGCPDDEDRKWGAKAVRIFLLVALFFASLKLLGVFDLLS